MTMLQVVCMYCGRRMPDRPGYGVTGTSAGLCEVCWAERFPGVPYPTEEEARAPDQTLGTQMLKGLVTGSINDITYEQMNRIVRALSGMRRSDRDAPKRVADVLTTELGAQKALQYLDKALAGGLITRRDFEAMRAALVLPLPREEIPRPTVARAAAELLETQTRIREDMRRLAGTGRKVVEKPFQDLDADVKRLRKAWGL